MNHTAKPRICIWCCEVFLLLLLDRAEQYQGKGCPFISGVQGARTNPHTWTNTHTHTFSLSHMHIHFLSHAYTNKHAGTHSLSPSLSLPPSLSFSLSLYLSHIHTCAFTNICISMHWHVCMYTLPTLAKTHSHIPYIHSQNALIDIHTLDSFHQKPLKIRTITIATTIEQ